MGVNLPLLFSCFLKLILKYGKSFNFNQFNFEFDLFRAYVCKI